MIRSEGSAAAVALAWHESVEAPEK